MKIIAKTRAVLISTRAETVVEVTVAFLVMSLVMVLFAQGMRYAQTAENYAVGKTNDCDKAMLKLQNVVAGKDGTGVTDKDVTDEDTLKLDGKDDLLKLKRYAVTLPSGGDTNTFYYFVFDANLG